MIHLATNHRLSASRLLSSGRDPFKNAEAVANGSEGVTQLMGEHSEEFILPAIGLSQGRFAGLQRLVGALALRDIDERTYDMSGVTLLSFPREINLASAGDPVHGPIGPRAAELER